MQNVKSEEITGKLQGVGNELFEQTSKIETVLVELQKAILILDILTDEYGFSEPPNPVEAIQYSKSTCEDENPHDEQSYKWIFEYEKIHQFMEIAADYVHESQQLLKQAIGEEDD